jgi:hypothetical protein
MALEIVYESVQSPDRTIYRRSARIRRGALSAWRSRIAWTEQTFPQEKVQERDELDRVITSLSSVDAAYASGNTAEAQTKLEEARSSWNEVSPAISAREAREAELLFDSLEIQLKSRAPAVELSSTVYSMLEKLSEDIARELR